MKVEIRILLADFKAASRIGHPQSLEFALDSFRALPEIASNQALSQAFLAQVLLPLGQSLGAPQLPLAWLRTLVDDRLAGVRALAAAALGQRYFLGKDVVPEDLHRLGSDPRSEVRATLAESLSFRNAADPERLLVLISSWLQDPSPRLRQTALQIVPSLATTRGIDALALLSSLHSEPDPEVRASLVEALTALAEAGLAEAILDQLALWTREPASNAWVISRVLSASWAAGHAAKALVILRDLESKTGANRQISHALRLLERHQEHNP